LTPNSRSYLNQFTQPDSIIPQQYDPQSWNRYEYALDNPVRYTDPTGHKIACDDGYLGTCGDTGYGDDPSLPTVDHSHDNKGGDNPTEHCNMDPCPKTYQQNQKCYMDPCPWTQLQPDNSLALPWQFDKLSAIGLRVDISGWLPPLPLFGGGLSGDFVYNLKSSEFSFMPSVNGMGGIGVGGSVTPNLLLVYDAPNNDALKGISGGAQINITPEIGVQAGYYQSQSKGDTGQYAQEYTIGPSFGDQGSAAGVLSFTPWNIQIFP
jgi:hypothetical protein